MRECCSHRYNYYWTVWCSSVAVFRCLHNHKHGVFVPCTLPYLLPRYSCSVSLSHALLPCTLVSDKYHICNQVTYLLGCNQCLSYVLDFFFVCRYCETGMRPMDSVLQRCTSLTIYLVLLTQIAVILSLLPYFSDQLF